MKSNKKSQRIPESVRAEAYREIVQVGAKINEMHRGLNSLKSLIPYRRQEASRG